MKLKKLEISERVVQRLTEYLSILKEARKQDNEINSIELAKIMNTTSAQVRKDLSTFGEFGVRGKGYDIDNLIEIITKITIKSILLQKNSSKKILPNNSSIFYFKIFKEEWCNE